MTKYLLCFALYSGFLVTQYLTQVVRLQSESSALEARAQQVEAEREPLARRAADLTKQLADLEAALTTEKAARLEEGQLLARKIAEKQEWGEKLGRQLEEAQGECAVLRRKQAQATKVNYSSTALVLTN